MSWPGEDTAADLTPPTTRARHTSAVWVTLDREGFHHWPDAPDQWKHLRSPHRHLFKLRAETTVDHDDRELTFEELRDHLERAWPGPKLGSSSCEHLARQMAEELVDVLGRAVTVTCSEDGESGATVRAV